MFARNTPTRMKGSAVVQGLKSLVSKLHPQLPLSAKESQRLLTALTTSFRKQLDQAHPSQPARDDNVQSAPRHVFPKSGTKQLHSSSATCADRHLASVLTSPLLSKSGDAQKPALDFESAKAELQSNPSKDPILLLEEYHQKGAATVPIALHCLEKVDQSVSILSDEKREAAIQEANAGKRALLWLWKSKLYETDEFVENTEFMKLLCKFLVRERADQYFWDWWKLDMVLGDPKVLHGSSRYVRNIDHSYRWRNRMLRGFVWAKLHSTKTLSPNSALNAFHQAADIKEAAMAQGTHFHQFSLLGAWHELVSAFHRNRRCLKDTDPQLYDRLLQRHYLVKTTAPPQNEDLPEYATVAYLHTATLWTLHPREPSPLPMLRLLRDLQESETQTAKNLYRYMTATETVNERRPLARRRQSFFHAMVRTFVLLQEDARIEDANWVIELTIKMYPENAPYLEVASKQERTFFKEQASRRSSEASHKHESKSHAKANSFIRLDLGSL